MYEYHYPPNYIFFFSMGVCCRRALAFIGFLIFGLICVGISIKVSNDNDDNNPSTYTYVLYGFLLLTALRYKQIINECQRWCSAIVIFVGYCAYWVLLVLLIRDLGDKNIYGMVICSVITAILDIGIFTNYFYEDDKYRYGPLLG